MLSVTLDTSCVQNFLNPGEQADSALIDVIGAALRHQVSVLVSQEAFEEVARTPDEALRTNRLERLRAFGPVRLPASRKTELDAVTTALHSALFPKATSGTRQDEHNWRDCRQIAAHKLIGRQYFLTRDDALLKRARAAAQEGVHIVSADELRDELQAVVSAGMASYRSISVRDADRLADEAAIRSVLSPLAADYPRFDEWLTKRLHDPDTRIRVGLFQDEVAAVALSSRKDPERVMKLSAFYVTRQAEGNGLGAHLLWSELRTWVREGLAKTYVTVSSRHADLIRFFNGFGFVVEGVSPRRYQDDTAEFVLAKHLIRARVEDAQLDAFAAGVPQTVFAVPGIDEIPDADWSLKPDVQRPKLGWEEAGAELRLVARDGDRVSRTWQLVDLERIFYPLRLAVAGRRALLVPIEQRWADALLEYAQQTLTLEAGGSAGKLLLRADNAYYAYPKSLSAAKPGTPIVFYVSEPVGALIGEARIFDAVVDEPEDLFLRFGGLGIYGLEDIRKHVMPNGPNRGKALALRFSFYAPFETLVPRRVLMEAAGWRGMPQGLTPIAFEDFEAVRRTGGIEW